MKPELYILGNGAMASAMAFGLRDNYEIIIVARDKNKVEFDGLKIISYDEFDLNQKDVILAFKPYALENLATKLKGQARILISVLANVNFEKLHAIKAQNYARIMPNIAAKFKASTTPYLLENESFKSEIENILNTFGKSFLVQNEKEMDIAMVLSGCVPAYLALVGESLANAGVKNGLKNDLSYKLTQSVFNSFCALFEHEHPAIIKEKICSPAGVTIKGIEVLEKKALRGIFYEAYEASASK